MPVRFSDAELARLSGWPDEIAENDLVAFFTLTSDDLGWLGSNIRAENRLGAAVQLCALPWLGWIPDDLSGCPLVAVERLGGLLGLAADEVPGLLRSYGGWEGRTRCDHRALVLARLGWRASGAGDRKQLDAFLLARALEHDAPGSTVTAFCASFQTVEQLALVKSFVGTAANSNEPLLMASDNEGGASAEAPRSIFGVPLWSLPEGTIADGTIWALDRGVRGDPVRHRPDDRPELLLRER